MRRSQEFVELVRQERMLDAIAYSRRHLSPWASQYQVRIRTLIASQAFRLAVLDTYSWASGAHVSEACSSGCRMYNERRVHWGSQ